MDKQARQILVIPLASQTFRQDVLHFDSFYTGLPNPRADFPWICALRQAVCHGVWCPSKYELSYWSTFWRCSSYKGWPHFPLMEVLYCLVRFLWLDNLQDHFSLTLMLSQNCLNLIIFWASALQANFFKVSGGQEKNTQMHIHMCASTHSLAGQHHCTSAVSMETRIKYWIMEIRDSCNKHFLSWTRLFSFIFSVCVCLHGFLKDYGFYFVLLVLFLLYAKKDPQQ